MSQEDSVSYLDDCLFKVSVRVNMEGVADMRTFEVDMERSFQLFINLLSLKLANNASEDYYFTQHPYENRPTDEVERLLYSYLVPQLKKSEAAVLWSKDDSLVGFDRFIDETFAGGFYISGQLLREVFAVAVNSGVIEVPSLNKRIPLSHADLVICFELEGTSNIYQYHWRSRWVLTLVNFLINSPKTSMRIFLKGAELIRLLRMRLSNKRSRQG